MRRVCVPDRYWLTTRPVVSQIGYSSSTTSADSRNGTPWNRALPSGWKNVPPSNRRGVPGWPTSGIGQNRPISSSMRCHVAPR